MSALSSWSSLATRLYSRGISRSHEFPSNDSSIASLPGGKTVECKTHSTGRILKSAGMHGDEVLCRICENSVAVAQLPRHVSACSLAPSAPPSSRKTSRGARGARGWLRTIQRWLRVAPAPETSLLSRTAAAEREDGFRALVRLSTPNHQDPSKRPQVYLCTKVSTGDVFVVKCMHVSANAKTELRLLSRCQHPLIVRIYYDFLMGPSTLNTPPMLCMVTDFVPGGDLRALLRIWEVFPKTFARFYLAEMAVAVEYLHRSLGIVHGDIKPENVLIDRTGHIKLTDFGLARDVQEPETIAETCLGTPDYMAPEVVGGQPANFASDVWSLGICLFEFLHGLPPFYADCPAQMFKRLSRYCEGEQLPLPNHHGMQMEEDELEGNENACNLIKALLHVEPNSRPTVSEFHNYTFLADFQWDNLEQNRPPFVPSFASSVPETGKWDTAYFPNVFQLDPPIPIDPCKTSGEEVHRYGANLAAITLSLVPRKSPK